MKQYDVKREPLTFAKIFNTVVALYMVLLSIATADDNTDIISINGQTLEVNIGVREYTVPLDALQRVYSLKDDDTNRFYITFTGGYGSVITSPVNIHTFNRLKVIVNAR